MDCSAIVLNKLLTEQSIELWSKLRLVYLDAAFSSLYSVIGKHYDKYGEIPSFASLELELREGVSAKTLAIVKLADAEDIPTDVAVDALIDQYTQNETIKALDKFIDKLPVYDTTEIKENLSKIVLDLDEKTLNSEVVFGMDELMFFKDPAQISAERIPFGINNDFDAAIGGCAREELVLVGGVRGSGKSIVCSNIQVNEYEAGFICPYFTIEMKAHEVFARNMAKLTKIDHNTIKKGVYTEEEAYTLVRHRAAMFDRSQEVVEEFLKHRDLVKFEQTLVRNCKLKEDGRMVIVDDRNLSLTSIDLHLGKLKAKYGDKLRAAVVDYLNQIVIEGADMYDWKPQIMVSKGLKNIARKHKVLIVSPYQIDASGEARFAKGILDAADIAMTLKVTNKEDGMITFTTTKMRSDSEQTFHSGMNWKCLDISPMSVTPPAKEEVEDKPKRTTKKKEAAKVEEVANDSPPWEV